MALRELSPFTARHRIIIIIISSSNPGSTESHRYINPCLSSKYTHSLPFISRSYSSICLISLKLLLLFWLIIYTAQMEKLFLFGILLFSSLFGKLKSFFCFRLLFVLLEVFQLIKMFKLFTVCAGFLSTNNIFFKVSFTAYNFVFSNLVSSFKRFHKNLLFQSNCRQIYFHF